MGIAHLMKNLLSLLILLFCIDVSSARDYYVRNPSMDIERYRYFIELNDQNSQIKGRAIVSIRALEAISDVTLDLAKSDENGKGMQVKQVLMGGKVLVSFHDGQRLRIQLPERLNANSLFDLEIIYQGEPASGLHISNNKFGDRVFFADNWPDQGHQWLPSIDHPSDKAAVEFIVTAPDHYEVVANGIKVEERNLEGNRKLSHWREDVPIAVKVMVIGVARFAIQESGKLKDVPITSWVFPQNKDQGFHDYGVAIKALDYFQKNIGPYPYKKLANVQSKTRFGGLENANTIFYFENSVTGKGEQEALIAHEIAHQWFGNSTTENDWHHVWLSEGFATYFTSLYIEHTFGREFFLKQMLSNREKVMRYHQKVSRPIIDTAVRDPKLVLNPNTYEKAAWVLHMLRQTLGDEVFWRGIREYYAKFDGKNVMTEDFQNVMEQVSGQNLSSFFQQWLYREGHPKLNVRWHFDESNKTLKIRVEQSQLTAAFDFPLELAVLGEGTQFELHTIRVNSQSSEVVLPLQRAPKALSLDPMVKLLFEGKVEGK